ncbi:cytochrome c oxidase subunit II [uncultured Sphingomonas sp.]|uniref:cytochrome c oxidase subunit II n=1 Tax=uncultured Sphingomonas sp. TaxID=158754 RepID=UPI0025D931DB|nr:cytochrome c oxidase subunit II [uncultured Sphingomonas sp.]
MKSIRGSLLAVMMGVAVAAIPAVAAQAPVSPAAPLNAGTPNSGAPVSTPPPPVVAAKPADIPHLAPTPGIGQPTDRVALQPQESPIGHEARRFHDYWLMPMMGIISVFVLALLLWVILRYRAAANPTPSRTHHHTVIEIVWTLLPVLILVAIAVPSIRLLAHQYSPPKADLTVKVVGNQWYWTYQYPDNGDFEIVSNMLPERADANGKRFRTDADGPRLLAVDERMVVPAGATVKLITTSADVIHSFALPAAWVKMDAVPGRLNETWFRIDRPGVYFGQCSELCGARHAFMPIAVEVVPPARFAQWVAFKGGTMPGTRPPANPDATSPSSPATAGSKAANAPVSTDPALPGTVAKPNIDPQPAVAQN